MSSDINYKNYIILIVDDNPTNLGVIVDYLEEYEFEIITARDGEEGLEKATYVKPDLVLLDVMMPGIDGFETCEQLKKNPQTKDIPIIFMTALASESDKVRGFDVGAVDYVTKPIQQREVLARVTTHLRIKNQAKLLQEQNQQLQKMTEELIESNASKDKFFSIVAHDLRGPFLPVLGNATLLSEMAEDLSVDDVKKMSDSIARAAKRVVDLLENLLKWSRIQVGRMEYKPYQLDLHKVTCQNVGLLKTNAKDKGIAIENQISEKLLVYADENMLHIVMRNLISNAIKFTTSGGQITVSAQQTEDAMIKVSIKDSGIGISEENIDQLFRIDVHHTTPGTAQEKGSGLGLIMCKEMVEMNGGSIWIKSKSGTGTVVMFTVPTV